MKVQKDLLDTLVGLTRALINEDGAELLNPNPMVVDVSPRRYSLREQIQRILRNELSRAAYKEGLETFEESQDFDIPDEDPLPMSPFEYTEMIEEHPESIQVKAEGVEAEPVAEGAGEAEEVEETSPT